MPRKDLAIGVFDSGLGGISVLKELQKQMPQEDFIYFGDSSYAPYGTKSKEAITNRCFHICDFFMEKGVKAIVVACNTATSACVKELRVKYPQIPIIGMEPALKVAADGKEKQTILVLATKFTLREKKFKDLMACYSEHNVILEQPCPKLVELVECGALDDEERIHKALEEYVGVHSEEHIDSIVLGCTHFVFFKKAIQTMVGEQVSIIDGNEGTARHVKVILQEVNALHKDVRESRLQLYNSTKDVASIELSQALLHKEIE